MREGCSRERRSPSARSRGGNPCFPHGPPSFRGRFLLGEPPGSPRPSPRSSAGNRPMSLVRDGMLTDPGTLSDDASAQAAAEHLMRPDVRVVLVVDGGGALVGV